MKTKNFFVLITISACFWFAWKRLYKFYYDNFPVANVGECIRFSPDGKTNLKALIIDNDNQYNESLLLEKRNDEIWPEVLSYSQLRDYNAKRIPCDEEVD